MQSSASRNNAMIGCAYCGCPDFEAIRIDVDPSEMFVTLVNWCPKCEREDWIRIHPRDLAAAAVLVESGDFDVRSA